MPYGMNASVRPPSGSLCNICPVVLCKRSHWNGRIGNVETACLRHTSFIYMAVLKGKSKLAGNLSFCITERRLCMYIHIDSQWRLLLMSEDAMLKSMHAEILMRHIPCNCSKRPIGLKNVHPSALAVSNKLPWQPESAEDALVELELLFAGKVSLYLPWPSVITSQ